MTREEAKQAINESLITSLGKLPHGYVVYASTAEAIIDKIFDEMPEPIAEFKCGAFSHSSDGEHIESFEVEDGEFLRVFDGESWIYEKDGEEYIIKIYKVVEEK